jgi:hypothetical protein
MSLAAKFAGTLFSPEINETSSIEMLLLNMRLYERTRQRFGHCVNTLLAPGLVEWSRWPLPRALFVLYVPLRMIRLLMKYCAIIPRRRSAP